MASATMSIKEDTGTVLYSLTAAASGADPAELRRYVRSYADFWRQRWTERSVAVMVSSQAD